MAPPPPSPPSRCLTRSAWLNMYGPVVLPVVFLLSLVYSFLLNSLCLLGSLLVSLVGVGWRKCVNFSFTSASRQNSPQVVGWCAALHYICRVRHWRHAPVSDSLDYVARWTVVDLRAPPKWWRRRRVGTLSHEGAVAFVRGAVHDNARVLLLCQPKAAGYAQNPIVVYYLFDEDDRLATCIAEVTNMPWGDAVLFQFDPNGEALPNKPLHVSPFTPMQASWTLRTRISPSKLFVHVTVVEHGAESPLLTACLEGDVDAQFPQVPNESLPHLAMFARYAYAPQRIALWIYAHAVHLVVRKSLRPFDAPAIARTLTSVGGTPCPLMPRASSPHLVASVICKDSEVKGRSKESLARPMAWSVANSYPWDHAHRSQ